MEKKNVSLESITDNPVVRKAPVDLTQGVVKDTPEDMPQNIPASINKDSMETVRADDILPAREQKNPLEDDIMAELDAAVDRECESITQRIGDLTDKQEEEFNSMQEAAEIARQDEEDKANVHPDLYKEESPSENSESDGDSILDGIDDSDLFDDDDDDEIDESEDTSTPTPVPSISLLKNNDIEQSFSDDEEVSDDEEEKDPDSEANAMLEELKKAAKEKIAPVKKTLDLSKFTISKKSINASKVMKKTAEINQHVADWALLNANRPISATGLSGSEILKLNPENSNRNRLNTFRDMYRVIYEHIYDANKPEFETWLKQTRYVDLQHIYFALYMATFGGSNFVNYTCPECEKVFIKDIKFEDMVVYSDDATRKRVADILKMDTTSTNADEYTVDIVQISDTYAFGLRTPSIWNVIIETASLSDNFIEKHADLIDIVSYIDSIYYIDPDSAELVPIDTKPARNDQAKTSARRIKIFYDIISTLTSEEYYKLRSCITSYDEDAEKLSYQIPACTCPKCAKEIPANTNVTPDAMLFTHHQLVAIANM